MHISISELNLLFEAHCVVVEGALPAQYGPKIHGRPTSQGRRLCTCGLFVQRAECPHVYFVAGLNDELDLNNVPEKRKPGRPKADAARQEVLQAFLATALCEREEQSGRSAESDVIACSKSCCVSHLRGRETPRRQRVASLFDSASRVFHVKRASSEKFEERFPKFPTNQECTVIQ